jgi:hypothetical protein
VSSIEELNTREAVEKALRDACELEHQLMLQYLYTGFSLKRGPDEACSPAQYEVVRRWSSTLFMVARQEMEHLSLANGMLTAIGKKPHFARTNIVERYLLSPYFSSETLSDAATLGKDALVPVDLPYSWDPFNVKTMKRFVCGESPPLADFSGPGDAPAYCFTTKKGPDGAADAGANALVDADADALVVFDRETFEAAGVTLDTPWLAPVAGALQNPRPGAAAGKVKELYGAIREAFLSAPNLFKSSPPEVQIPVEYNVFVFPVIDQRAAIGAIDVILEQGEGTGNPWNADSHFHRFHTICEEVKRMEKETAGQFVPAYPLVSEPHVDQIAPDFTATRAVFEAANDAYATLLLILDALYQVGTPPGQDTYPYLSSALRENAFAPAMTMIIRALNEVLVLLPIDAEGKNRIGCDFLIGEDDLARLRDDRRSPDFAYLHGRWERTTRKIGEAAAAVGASGLGGLADAARDLEYVHQSAIRAGANLSTTYQFGPYPKYIKI